MKGTGSMCERLRGALDSTQKSTTSNSEVWTFGNRCSICSQPAKEVYRQVSRVGHTVITPSL